MGKQSPVNFKIFECDTPLDWTIQPTFSPEASYQRVKGLVYAAQQFFILGNTATGVQRRWNAHEILSSLPVSLRTPRIRALVDTEELNRIIQIRHPDPVESSRNVVVFPTLQIRGLWQIYNFGASVRTTLARFGFSSFIWRSMWPYANLV